MGEARALSVTITNDGALQCPYEIKRLHTTQPVPSDGSPQADATTLFGFSPKGVLEPYSQTQIKVTFRPAVAGEAASLLSIEMGDVAPPVELSLHGLGAEVPIYVERET
eukprot:2788712-Prymnesium_polylepis.1